MSNHTVFELRRYRLQPNTREKLIEVFDREFVETQEALGMGLPGQFRDLDDPDAFVWLRSFDDMDARTAALQDFYKGPTWKQHGPVANSTMINSDNVLLLKPTGSKTPFPNNLADHSVIQHDTDRSGIVVVNICSLAPHTESEFAAAFDTYARPVIEEAGARIEAMFVTERSANSFPRLPVREGETVFVWLAIYRDERSYLDSLDRLAKSPAWITDVYPKIDAQLWRKMETACLTPTARSLLAW